MTARRDARVVVAAVAASVLTVGLSGVARGQPARPAAAPAVAKPAAVAAAAGLDGLSDDRVMDELAGRGVNSLLNKLFDERKVPVADREAFRSLQALRELKGAGQLTDGKRIELMAKSVEGLNALLPKLTDGTQLTEYAVTLIGKGIEPDVNILDYWGDNPVRQARIKMAADLSVKMLNKASDEALNRMNVMQNQIRSATDPRMAECEKLFETSNQTKYVANLASYYQVVAIDATGPNAATGIAERKKLADPAIKYLSDFATPDSGAGPTVLLRLGRLAMAKADFVSAKKYLQSIVDKKVPNPEPKQPPLELTNPAPTVWQENEARYFSVVTDVLAKKLPEAEKGLADLDQWQKAVTDAEFKKESKVNDAQMLMLRYRVVSAKADAAAAGPEREKLERAAEDALEKLGAVDKSFGALVAEQLVSRVKDTTDLTKLGTPVLQALAERAVVEWGKPQGQPFDEAVLERGLKAARVIAGRKPGDGGPTAAAVENAKLRVALFLQKQGKLADATAQYLDYATDPEYQKKPNAARAVDTAQFLAIQLYAKNTQDKATGELYDRMLKVVCNPPFEHPEMFYFYATRLRSKAENAPEAIKFYAKVPKGDKKEFDARYWQMVLDGAQLDKVRDPGLRNTQARKVAALAAQVRTLAQAALAQAGDAEAQQRARFRIALATLTDAELALQTQPPDATRSAKALQGFEQTLAGLPQAEGLTSRASFVRATALLAADKTDDATVQINKLAADPKTADSAANLVQQLLGKLDADIKAFQKSAKPEDKPTLITKVNQRAKVSGLLMPIAEKQADPKKREEMKRAVIYYDANAKFMAGQLLPAGAEKKQRLGEAKAVFEKLLAQNANDVRSIINAGKCDYELGDLDAAITRFVPLVQQQKLGPPTIQVEGAGGNITEKDNDDFWEVNYLLNMARYKKAQPNPSDPASQAMVEAARKSILPLFVIHGERTGGENFRKEYLELRALLAPEAATQPAATTAPAS
jgi:tetratricopeptide (TPR) repeat protein